MDTGIAGNIKEWAKEIAQKRGDITTVLNIVDIENFKQTDNFYVRYFEKTGRSTGNVETTFNVLTGYCRVDRASDVSYVRAKGIFDSYGIHSFYTRDYDGTTQTFNLPFENYDFRISVNSSALSSCTYSHSTLYNILDDTSIYLQNVTDGYTGLSRRSNYPYNVAFLKSGNWLGCAFFQQGIEHTSEKPFIDCSYYFVELNDDLVNALGRSDIIERYEPDDPYFGISSEIDGFDGIDYLYGDTIGIGPQPLSISSCGFMNIYKVDTNSLQQLGKDLFSDIDLNFDETVPVSAERYQEMLLQSKSIISTTNNLLNDVLSEEEINKEIVTNGLPTHGLIYNIANLLKASINNYFSSQLIKYIVDCHIVPVTPTVGALENINIGYRQFNQQGKKCVGDFVTKSCGSLTIPNPYKNFLDYSETKCKLYLPFVGIVDISPQYVFNQELSIDYKFNIIDGSCLAFVSSTGITGSKSVVGSYSGSACMHLPITGENYSSALNGMLATVGGFASNPMAGVSALLGNASAFSGSVLSSNGYGGSSSFMGIRTPYIIIEQPIPNLPPRYFRDHGALSLVVSRLENCSGFTKCRDVKIPTTIPASIAERIKTKLETGVIM